MLFQGRVRPVPRGRTKLFSQPAGNKYAEIATGLFNALSDKQKILRDRHCQSYLDDALFVIARQTLTMAVVGRNT